MNKLISGNRWQGFYVSGNLWKRKKEFDIFLFFTSVALITGLPKISPYVWGIAWEIISKSPRLYYYLWKAKWEIILEYIILDSIQDALIDRGIYGFLNWGSSKPIGHNCLAGCSHLPKPALKIDINYCEEIKVPKRKAKRVPKETPKALVKVTEDDGAKEAQIASKTMPSIWLQDYAWSFAYHMTVKTGATLVFPIVYPIFTYIHKNSCNEVYICEKSEHVTENFIQHAAVNPLEGIYIFDRIIEDSMVRYFPDYIESRAKDPDFQEVMTAYLTWMESVDAGMHGYSHINNIVQNWNEPYMWAKLPTLMITAAALKYNTDIQEAKIDLLIDNARNQSAIEDMSLVGEDINETVAV